jgi:hypothetical protein
MRDYELPQRPPKAPLWQRLKYQLELWSIATSAQPGAWHTLRLTCAILLPFFIILMACVVPILILLFSGPLIAGFFFVLSRYESLANPVAEIIFALLCVLSGLGSLLTANRRQVGIAPNPPRRGLALLFSKTGTGFWVGTLLCALVAAQIAVPAFAFWLSILFWVISGCAVLWSFLHLIFLLGVRRLRRPAHWQY